MKLPFFIYKVTNTDGSDNFYIKPNEILKDRGFISGQYKLKFNILKNRIFNTKPEYGDLIVFKTPSDNRTDYIKRLIGFPGDHIQFKDNDLYINKVKIKESPEK